VRAGRADDRAARILNGGTCVTLRDDQSWHSSHTMLSRTIRMHRPSINSNPVVFRTFRTKLIKGKVVQGDALEFLRSLPEGCADLVFLDPPFNLGKHYTDGDRALDKKPPEAYAAWLVGVGQESARVLRKGGALYFYHMPIWAMRLGSVLEKELQFRHWIAISMKNGFVRGRRLYPAHYALLYFTKGAPKAFRRPKLDPARCRHCNELIKDYGGYLSIIQEKGINLSDFWEDLSPVRHATTKHRKANELPSKLFDRIIRMSGRRGGLYVDPFAGSGSGAVAATKAGMRFAVCDLLAENCSLVCKRLEGCAETYSPRRQSARIRQRIPH